jgi:hypothetical protein
MKAWFASVLGCTGCSTVTPGHVVVAVDVCGSGAGQYSVVRGGRYWPAISACTDFYELPVMEQRAVWTKATTEGSPYDSRSPSRARTGSR